MLHGDPSRALAAFQTVAGPKSVAQSRRILRDERLTGIGRLLPPG